MNSKNEVALLATYIAWISPPASPASGISFVGSGTKGWTNATTQTYNFSSLLDASGNAPTLQENDIVLVSVANAYHSSDVSASMTPTGYTNIVHLRCTDTRGGGNLNLSYKIMGATPDTSVLLPSPDANTVVGKYSTIFVFRGVDTTTPLDVAATTATGSNTYLPNPPSITPTTAGAWILVTGGGFGWDLVDSGDSYTQPADTSALTNHWRAGVEPSSLDVPAIGTGLKTDWSSGAWDLGAWTTTGAHDSTGLCWAACCVALRPV